MSAGAPTQTAEAFVEPAEVKTRQPDQGASPQRRSIGFWGAFSIVAGSMLGIGIFLSPTEMARSVASPWAFLGIWALAGVIVVGGAVAYAELGTRFPRAGGDYVFHREAFGPSVAFATGWGLFGAIFCGSIAAVAVAICQYQLSALTGIDLSQPVPGLEAISWAQVFGSAIVVGLTALNAQGVRLSAFAQQVTTLTPVVVLFAVAVVALVLWSVGQVDTPAPPATPAPSLSVQGIIAAYLAAYFAYSGWNAVIYVAGEVEDPARNIPRALVGGTLTITALYMLLCLAFIAGLGMGNLAAAGEAGSALAGVLGGETGRGVMNVLVLMCLVATLNGSILGGGRVAFAMARDKAFWQRAGHLDPRSGTPTFALWLQAGVSIVLILTNRFEDLLQAVSLTMVVTGSLTVVALFVVRARGRGESGYTAFGWPWLPLIYLISSALVILGELWLVFDGQSRGNPLVGLVVLVGAYALHALWRRRTGA